MGSMDSFKASLSASSSQWLKHQIKKFTRIVQLKAKLAKHFFH